MCYLGERREWGARARARRAVSRRESEYASMLENLLRRESEVELQNQDRKNI